MGLAHGQLGVNQQPLSCDAGLELSAPGTEFCSNKCSERYCCDSDKGHCKNTVCPEICETGCFCAAGLARDPITNNCIPKEDCNSRPSVPTCNVNEEWNSCGSKCKERYCCNSEKGHCSNEVCPAVCEPRCECVQGYARSYQGHCVPKAECVSTDGVLWNPTTTIAPETIVTGPCPPGALTCPGLNELNVIRRAHGLPEVDYDSELAFGAMKLAENIMSQDPELDAAVLMLSVANDGSDGATYGESIWAARHRIQFLHNFILESQIISKIVQKYTTTCRFERFRCCWNSNISSFSGSRLQLQQAKM